LELQPNTIEALYETKLKFVNCFTVSLLYTKWVVFHG